MTERPGINARELDRLVLTALKGTNEKLRNDEEAVTSLIRAYIGQLGLAGTVDVTNMTELELSAREPEVRAMHWFPDVPENYLHADDAVIAGVSTAPVDEMRVSVEVYAYGPDDKNLGVNISSNSHWKIPAWPEKENYS